MNIQYMFLFLIFTYLIQYELGSKNSLNCFATFGSPVCQGSLSWAEYYLALQFDFPMANFAQLIIA